MISGKHTLINREYILKKILPVLILFILATGTVSAQDHRAHIFILPGASFPASPDDLTLNYKVGLNAGLSYQMIRTDKLGFMGEINVQRYPVKPDRTLERLGVADLGGTLSGGSITTVTVMGNVVLSQVKEGVKGIPYFTAGTGLYAGITEEISVALGDSKISEDGDVSIVPGLNFGAGIKYFYRPDFGFVIDTRYIIGLTKNDFSHLLNLRLGCIFTLKK